MLKNNEWDTKVHHIYEKYHLTHSLQLYTISGINLFLKYTSSSSFPFCVCAFVPLWLTWEKQENDGYSEGVAIFDSELNC